MCGVVPSRRACLSTVQVEVQRVKEHRRRSLEKQQAEDAALEQEEAALVRKVVAIRITGCGRPGGSCSPRLFHRLLGVHFTFDLAPSGC